MTDILNNLSDAFGRENTASASIIAQGVGGFNSDIKIQEKQIYESLSPDVPLEDGTYVQDHIILKPVIIEIAGQIAPRHYASRGEKFVITPPQIANTIDAFLPRKTAFQLQQVDKFAGGAVDTVGSYFTGFSNIFDGFKGDKEDLMQVFSDFILEIRNSKILVDIKMPFKTYKNMLIQSFTSITDNEADVLDYELSAKSIVIAESKLITNFFNKGAEPINDGLLQTQEVLPEVCSELLGSICSEAAPAEQV
jgi:hypothetical protein